MNNIIGENLKKFRISKKYTQEQAAQLLSVSAQSVSRWETGATLPDVMLLPEIAKLYCVTVDDLYRENSVAYGSFAARLASVFESTSSPADFMRADSEFKKLMKLGQCTAEDLRIYGILNQQMMLRCMSEAEKFLDLSMEKAAERDLELFYRTKRQKLLFLCQAGKINDAVKKQENKVLQESENSEEWLLLVLVYHYAGDDLKAYKTALSAVEKFSHCADIHACAGDICKSLNKYDEAFGFWNKAIEIDGKCYDAKYSKAFCFEETGEFQKAYDMWCEIADELKRAGYEAEVLMPKMHADKCREKI